MSTRSYDNTLRAEQARQTRARILEAARALLLSDGHQKLTIAELAAAAGVAVQTIYNAVGGKAAVVKAVWDVTLAGDDEPVPMRDRPEVQAMQAAPDAPAMVAAYASMSRGIVERTGSLLAVLVGDGDPELRELVRTLEEERRNGNTAFVSELARRFRLPKGLTVERAVDEVWTLTSPEAYERLVVRCDWSLDEYQAWLTRSLTAALTTPRGGRAARG